MFFIEWKECPSEQRDFPKGTFSPKPKLNSWNLSLSVKGDLPSVSAASLQLCFFDFKIFTFCYVT